MKKNETAVLYASRRYGSMTDDELVRHVNKHTGKDFLNDDKVKEARASLVFKGLMKQDPENPRRWMPT